jgi:hypothetical protein
MDAIKLLQDDHFVIKRDMDEIGGSADCRKRDLFQALKRTIKVHDGLMQNIFYPSMMADARTSALIGHGQASHLAVEEDVAQLDTLHGEDRGWTPAFNALRQHLVKRLLAEESELLLQLRLALGTDELHGVGHQMTTERERMLKSY